MPRLELLQIWNCGGGSGAVFRFEMRNKESKPPKVSWGSTWPSQYTSQHTMFEDWRKLARKRVGRRREPEVVAYTLPPVSVEKLNTKWGLRDYLDMEPLHPYSETQVSWEEMMPFGQAGSTSQ
jgi:hypothetical protein